MLLPLLIAAVIGYLLGSLPFGYLVAKSKGVDIFEVGSKSPGATNVRRVLGSGPGTLVFFLDVLKGAAAPWGSLLIFLVYQNIFGEKLYWPWELQKMPFAVSIAEVVA